MILRPPSLLFLGHLLLFRGPTRSTRLFSRICVMRGNSHITSKFPPGSSLIVRKTSPWWSCGAVTWSERPSSLILLAGSPPRKRGRRPFYFELRGRRPLYFLVAGPSPRQRGRHPVYFLRGRHLSREAVVPFTSSYGAVTSSERPSSLILLAKPLRGRHLVREAVVP